MITYKYIASLRIQSYKLSLAGYLNDITTRPPTTDPYKPLKSAHH